MKKLTINQMLNGYSGATIPKELDASLLLEPTLSLSDDNSGYVLFLTDKVNGENEQVDLSEIKRPPNAIVASHKKSIKCKNCHIIRVDDCRTALAYAFYNAHEITCKSLKIIGVTGTCGKTTTATLIYEILSIAGYKTGFIGTGKIISDKKRLTDTTYSMTTPDPTVLYAALSSMVDDGCDYVVMEVSSHSIALSKIAPINFEYAIFTNLDTDHLDFHKTMDDYFSTKLKLFKNTKHGLFNIDDEYGRKAYSSVKCKKSSFGIIRDADAYAVEINADSDLRISFFYRSKDIIFKVKSNMVGVFNTYNLLAAIKCTIDLGIKPCIVKRAIESVTGIEGRMEIICNKVRSVIDYAHTPSAFKNCLKTLKSSIIKGQKLIVVFGCGGDRDKSKRKYFGQYADKYADLIIITEDNCRNESFTSIASDILSGIRNKSFEIIPDRESAIRYAFSLACENDTVAVIGKGHEKYIISGNEYIPFDEKSIIMDCLSNKEILL